MGDTRQNDINKKYVAVDTFIDIISTINGCGNFRFDKEDIVREQILIDIIDRFEEFEDAGKMPGTIRNYLIQINFFIFLPLFIGNKMI